jgi:hypothetical protein
MEGVMTNITASELKRARSTVENRRDLTFHNWARPDKLEIPSNINSTVINPPTLVVLDTPNFIYANPSTMLTASHIQARNSTAQIEYSNDPAQFGTVNVGFHFWFENSSPKPVLLSTIASRLVITGVWTVFASCTTSPLQVNEIFVTSGAYLRIVEFWHRPPSSPPQEDSQFVEVAFLLADGGWCATDSPGHQKREWISNQSYDPKYSSLEIPSKGVVLFDVNLYTTTITADSTNVAVILASVACPSVQFEVRDVIQSGPPI